MLLLRGTVYGLDKDSCQVHHHQVPRPQSHIHALDSVQIQVLGTYSALLVYCVVDQLSSILLHTLVVHIQIGSKTNLQKELNTIVRLFLVKGPIRS